MMTRSFLFLALTCSLAQAEIKAGDAIDYSKLAFYPKRWEQQKIDTNLHPWVGKNVALLTIHDGLDPAVMTGFVGRLDDGWQLYLDLTGKAPRPLKTVAGKPTIAAIPGNGLTCGYGCGYVGATGIEMTNFYDGHYEGFKKNPKAIPHAYYYEMGRNFFTFEHRHSCFTTGFAVFMRYVCLDKLKGVDNDQRTRQIINAAIDDYAKSDLPFLKIFTNSYGLTEKQNRLQARPTDQPVMYASAMLKLWKQHGDDWLKGFYRHLHKAPQAPGKSKEGARTQCLSWYLAASLAAQKDLAPTFVDQWRLPLTDKEKAALKDVNWKDPQLTITTLLQKISA